MRNLKFDNIRIYTEDSLNFGVIKLEELIKIYKKYNEKNLVVCNLNNLSNSVDFYNKCIDNKIKPILGCEINIINKFFENCKILILIKNKLGYLNLSKILSRSSLYNNNKIETFWFKSNLRKGLIIINGSLKSDIGFSLKKNKKSLLNFYINYWKKIFKKNFFLEIQRNIKFNDIFFNNKIIKISNKFKIPLIATHITVFIKKKDFLLNEIKICIQNNKTLNVKNFIFNKENFFYKKNLMIKLFKDLPEALNNTSKLCEKCNLILDLNKIKLPYYLKNNYNNNRYLLKYLKKKVNKNIKINKNLYYKRILKECYISVKMNVVDYFLIIKEITKWSNRKFITKGPGRGSCSASLISYFLNITNIDPIKYNLIFERFLNIERISIPDFDLDYCSNKRELILKYLKYNYGINKIFQILTFNKMTIKNSIRDVGRVLNFNYNFINSISKNFNLNKINILKKNVELKGLINKCIKLEGLKKNIGIHSGGVVLFLNNFFFYYSLINNNNVLTTIYDKDDIEILGLIKIDFLSLKTLTVIKNFIKYKKNFNLDNKIYFFWFKKSYTDGIFQLESYGLKETLKKSKPIKFENITSIISIYRPGPINLIKNFYLRKLNLEKTKYIDLKLKNLLKETYGLVIYQEQVIFITKIISNFSLAKSDILRRAMSKKDILKMSYERDLFCSKAITNKFKKKKANILFNLLEKFSGYGFNKSHAAAYAYLSCYMLHLKLYYNIEFFTSNMSYYVNNLNKILILFKEALSNNIIILPININKSNRNFSSYKGKICKIRIGFKSIKGLGDNIITEILELRRNKKFKSFEDFYFRVGNNINYRIIECLISSGAFDCLDYNKAKLIKILIFIINNYNLKKKINIKKFIFKKKREIEYFWNYNIQIYEEYNILGFNFFYNLYSKYLVVLNDILDFNDYYFYGIIFNIYNKDIYNIIICNFVNDEYVFNLKIKKFLFKKYKDFFKFYNFLIMKIDIFREKFYYIKSVFDLKNFLFSYKEWLEYELIWQEGEITDFSE